MPVMRWVLLWTCLPATAWASCLPAEWQVSNRVGLTDSAPCPEVSDSLSAEANHASFVAVCGWKRRCGQVYAQVQTHGGLFLVPTTQVRALPSPYPTHLPQASTATEVSCLVGHTVPGGADFWPLDAVAGEQSRVGAKQRVPGGVPLALCRRTGPWLMAWLDGRPGLLSRQDVRPGDRRLPEAAWQPDLHVCRQPVWTAVARKDTRLFAPQGRPPDLHADIAEGTPLAVTSSRPGRRGGLWLLASFASLQGWVWSADVDVAPGLSWSEPIVSKAPCPAHWTVATTHKPLQIGPLRLDAGTDVLVRRHSVMVAGALAPWVPASVWSSAPRQASLRVDVGQELAAAEPGTARDDNVWNDLADTLPAWQPPQPGTMPTVADWRAHPADAATGAAQTPLQGEVARALQGQPQPSASPSVPRWHRVRQVSPVAWAAAERLSAHDPAGALLTVLDAADIGRPLDGLAWHGLAEALLQLGLPAVAGEVWLDLLAAQAVPDAVALAGYRASASRGQPHPRAVALLRPACARQQPEACFLGLQAALAIDDLTAAAPYAQAMQDLPLDSRERALLAVFHAQVDADPRTAARLLAQATRQACALCPKRSELVQTLLLQTARAVADADDMDATATATQALAPPVLARHVEIQARMLQAHDQPEAVAQAVARWERHTHTPEAALWQAQTHIDLGQFAAALQDLERVAAQVQLRQRIVAAVGPDVLAQTHPPTILRQLDAVLRGAGASSRRLPELASVLQPSGACGWWLEVDHEAALLMSAVANHDAVLPPRLQARVDQLVAQQARACVHGLQAAIESLGKHATELANLRDAAMVDLREAQVRQLDDELRRVEATAPE